MAHTLQNFSLGETGDRSLYEYDGEDYGGRAGGGPALPSTFIQLPQRERKRNYDIDQYFRDTMRGGERTETRERKPKGMAMHDFQFFQRDKIEALLKKEQDLAAQRKAQLVLVKDARVKEAKEIKAAVKQAMKDAEDAAVEAGRSEAEVEAAREAARERAQAEEEARYTEAAELEAELERMQLTEEEAAEKDRLLAEGFGNWNKTDFRRFVSACEKLGRAEKAAVCADVAEATGKSVEDVARYYDVFWEQYKELADWKKVLDRIEKGEQRIQVRRAG